MLIVDYKNFLNLVKLPLTIIRNLNLVENVAVLKMRWKFLMDKINDLFWKIFYSKVIYWKNIYIFKISQNVKSNYMFVYSDVFLSGMLEAKLTIN